MQKYMFIGIVALITMQAQAKLTIHEWGTFTSFVGSNGELQDGMYQEDEELPNFVYNFGDPDWPSVFNPDNLEPQPRRNCPIVGKIPCEFLQDQIITQKISCKTLTFC